MEFDGKVAIVTGGAQGIGRSFCNALLNLGMKVCVCDINEEVAKEFIESLSEAYQKNTIFQKCDVASFEEFKDTFEKVISVFGRVDLLVNNAGIFNEHDWKKVVEVNFIGVINGVKLGFEFMSVEKGGVGGYIVNTASNAGFEAFDIAPVYTGCKHGVVGVTKSYGTELHLKRSGIQVCAVCPGSVDTALFRNCFANCLDDASGLEHIVAATAIQPEVVADALIKILKDGKNGSFLHVNNTGCWYSD